MSASSAVVNLRGGIYPRSLHPTAGSTTHKLKAYCSTNTVLNRCNKNAPLCQGTINFILTETTRTPTLPEVLTSRCDERRAHEAAQRRGLDRATVGEPYFDRLHRMDRPAYFSTPATRHQLPLLTARSAYAERLHCKDSALLFQINKVCRDSFIVLRSMSCEVCTMPFVLVSFAKQCSGQSLDQCIKAAP
jgi:hypothetical protein